MPWIKDDVGVQGFPFPILKTFQLKIIMFDGEKTWNENIVKVLFEEQDVADILRTL